MIGDGDVATILGNGDFNVNGVFTRQSGGTVTTPGWFVDKTQQSSVLTNEIETVDPKFDCETSAIATVKRGDTVLINSVTYTVERIQNNGIGISTVHLKT